MAHIRTGSVNIPVQILGSTGSIGRQALDVADRHGYRVLSLSACSNAAEVEKQARRYQVTSCAMTDVKAAQLLKIALADTDIRVYAGAEGLCEMIRSFQNEKPVVLNAIAGEAGLLPSLAALESGMDLALANKETMVVAGPIVMEKAKKHQARVLPVDSEHCAIWQCLNAGKKREVNKLILTASGGPFFGKSAEELKTVTVRDALAHPTWHMGAQITVDSATLMNKGFEIMEAAYLFSVDESQIDVLVHKESIVHSMVEFRDHSVIAQMSVPDMRFCIAHAIEYPRRNEAVIPPLSLSDVGTLHFAKPDTETFPLLDQARKAYRTGGASGAVLNASNEVAVDAFLKEKIRFPEISDLIAAVCDKLSGGRDVHTVEGILEYDALARSETKNMIRRR